MPLLNEILSPERIMVLEESNQKEMVEKLLTMIKGSPLIKNFDTIKDAIWEREKIISTGIGLELAIPHTRREDIKGFIASAVLVKKGVDWKAIDDKLVKFAILVCSPSDSHKQYLKLLAQTVLLWKDDYKRKKILESNDPFQIYNILKELNF
ncbi:MAG: hypothetical protein A2086_07400 [Spirochaetes bacterium GWD1_27_9]|nr:MAG: hypothetical protein A2Z98_13265 [Spirochaetes bacterium GWB1_27_13]OHD26281.1 MAG: hypothetical protein A2Y34_13200 [Spirochaetes bacterium GWC1_27_15]OHD32119.1 MAG: hypothetical protein A2086_07400 [Spirochaetes bacterium GWD1_27_9]